ncbi:MAG: urea ABC transporter permease subunit UrtB, partial [Oxalobacteraceae bacterium]
MNKFIKLTATALLCLHAAFAHAAIDPALLAPLAGDDPDARIEAVGKIAALANDDAYKVLSALKNDTLYATPEGRVLIVDGANALDPATDATAPAPEGIDNITVNNRLRGVVEASMAGLKLFSQDRGERLGAARELQKGADAAQAPLIVKALAAEQDPEIRPLLEKAAATANLQSPDPAIRRSAAQALADSSNASLVPVLRGMVEKGADGSFSEPDETVRAAAAATLQKLERRLAMTEIVGNLFYGVSLGSVLLLAALGLAITFGLMGIINMAHGELLMIGAYATYVCQLMFRKYLPEAIDAYLLVALPVAFLASALVGIVLERTVIRWLYGRPLETLLATWGISLMLIQAIRLIFGAQNVEVANPAWLSGGWQVLPNLVLPYNRIVIIAFALSVVVLTWLLLNKTRLGLNVRAVTQNRNMAACCGVPTGRVDMLAFGLGSGIAGLGGVALSQ